MSRNSDISLKKVSMRVVNTADCGEVNTETLFEFTQENSIVSARYSGGKIQLGYLVGKIVKNEVKFRYAQIDLEGRIDGGSSTGELSRTRDGRIRLLEHFTWDSRKGSGTNVFEEIINI